MDGIPLGWRREGVVGQDKSVLSLLGKAPPNLPPGVPPLLPNPYIMAPGLLHAYPVSQPEAPSAKDEDSVAALCSSGCRWKTVLKIQNK